LTQINGRLLLPSIARGLGSRRIDAGISLFLHLDESWCHAHVVDVAQDVLPCLQLLDKAARVATLEQRRKELCLVAQTHGAAASSLPQRDRPFDPQ